MHFKYHNRLKKVFEVHNKSGFQFLKKQFMKKLKYKIFKFRNSLYYMDNSAFNMQFKKCFQKKYFPRFSLFLFNATENNSGMQNRQY